MGLVAPRFKAHIKHEKVNEFIENFNVFNFFFNFFWFFFFFLLWRTKIKLLINVNQEIQVAAFEIQVATFWHSSEQLSSILRAQLGKAYAAYTGGSKMGTFYRH